MCFLCVCACVVFCVHLIVMIHGQCFESCICSIEGFGASEMHLLLFTAGRIHCNAKIGEKHKSKYLHFFNILIFL